MKIKIHITKEVLRESMYCERGEKEVGFNCAVSVAVQKIFPLSFTSIKYLFFMNEEEYKREIAYRSTHETYDLGSLFTAELPAKATMFIVEFDNSSPEERERMQPMSFEIDVPEEVINRIGLDEVKKLLSESKTMELA